MLIYILIFIVASLILIRSSAILVRALLNIARFMAWSEFIVSFALMALATSLPDLFIGISAGFQKISNLSLGNAIGANVLKLSLVAGLLIIFARGTKIHNQAIIKRDVWIVLGLNLLPLIFLANKTISRVEALILLAVFFGYLIYLLRQKKHNKTILKNHLEIETFFKSIVFFIIGAILLLASAWLVVYSVRQIAVGFDISLILAGIFLVAIGTTLPEFVFGLRAVLMKHEEMYIGNLLGATAANSLLVLGTAGLISPIILVEFKTFFTAYIFMILAIIAFAFFMRTGKKLSWWEGALLILFYIVFVIINIAI